jgi:hypothetical protein
MVDPHPADVVARGEATGLLAALEHRDRVAREREPERSAEARGAGAEHDDARHAPD